MAHVEVDWGFNGHLPVVLDIITTGPTPVEHDIAEIGVIPLTYRWERDKRYQFVDFKIRPRYPENNVNLSKERLNVCLEHGLEHFSSGTLFIKWFENLKLDGKRLQVLGFNICSFIPFLIDWLGPANYDAIFFPYYRDLQAAALYCNDYSVWKGNLAPYPKPNLTYLMNVNETRLENKHDVMTRCLMFAEAYKRMTVRIL